MRDVPSQPALSFSDAPPPASHSHAKEFVRWCCSFGPCFRNSPDKTNLRYWAQKNSITIENSEETEILKHARVLFLKRVELVVQKAGRLEKPN
jgi:hypothetical protein